MVKRQFRFCFILRMNTNEDTYSQKMIFTIFYCAHFYIVQRLTENQHQQQVEEDGKDVEPGEGEEDDLLQDTGEVGIPPPPPSLNVSDQNLKY